MSSQPVKTSFPRTRLSQLAERAGGIGRDEAIENGMKSVESMRGEGDETILQLIAAIVSTMHGARNHRLPAQQIQAILHYADQIVTLSDTFGYTSLGQVLRSLCDVADGLVRAGMDDAAPIAVHIQSMQLLAPGSTTLSPAQIEVVLGELAKVRSHYNFASFAAAGDTVIAPLTNTD